MHENKNNNISPHKSCRDVVSEAEDDPGKTMALDAAGMSSSSCQEESRTAVEDWLCRQMGPV